MSGYYVVLRGPLGAGKTTVAHELSSIIGGKTISVDPILERWEWDGGSESLFLRANRVAVARARLPLRQGRPVVFEGNFYWKRVLDDLRARLPLPHIIVTLKVPLRVCVARDRARSLSYGAASAREVYSKVTRVKVGIPIDATPPVVEVVRAITARLPRARAPRDESSAHSR